MCDRIVRLKIYSWSGLSIGAIHYYAELNSYVPLDSRSGQRIQRSLSKANAISINRRMRLTHSNEVAKMYMVKPGEMDYRFDTEEDARETAIRLWKDIYPDADVLQENEIVLDRNLEPKFVPTMIDRYGDEVCRFCLREEHAVNCVADKIRAMFETS